MARLVIQSGKHKGKQVVIPGKEVVVGRDEGCFIRLVSTEISRQHCVLQATPHGILVRDLGSSNGTFVNDVQIAAETILRPGDVLRIGPAEFEVPGIKPQPVKMDDDIVEWLSDGDTHTPMKDMDTTIVTPVAPGAAGDSDAKEAGSTGKSSGSRATMARTAGETSGASPPKRIRKEFNSVAEEAADIIRRHFEWLKSEEQ